VLEGAGVPEPKLKVGAGMGGVLPNEGAGAGALELPLLPNVKGLLSGALGAAPPKLKPVVGVEVVFPPKLKPVEAGCEGAGAGNLKPVLAG